MPDVTPKTESPLADAIRESLDANNVWEQDSEGGILSVYDGNKDALAEDLAADIANLISEAASKAVAEMRDAIIAGKKAGDDFDATMERVRALIASERPSEKETGR